MPNSVVNFIIVYRLFVAIYAIFAFRLVTGLFGDNAFGYIMSIVLTLSLAVFPQKAYKTHQLIFADSEKEAK